MGNKESVQAHIIYSGRVQGVGFRFQVQREAARLALTGWVKNLPDGRVEIKAEGPRSLIEELCQRTDAFFNRHIRSKEIEYASAQGTYKDFHIAY